MEILINGEAFTVGVAAVKRTFNIIEKYRVMTEDGAYHREIEGIYKNYALELGNVERAEYDRLIETLLSNKESQKVTLPDGQKGSITYEAMFEGIEDEVVTEDADGVFFDNLTVTFTAKEPI